MNKKKKINTKNIVITVIALIISSTILLFETKKMINPEELYRVYLNGETIGYVDDKEILENYIDEAQSSLKEKYKVDKVYVPKNLDIVKEITYFKEPSTEKEIYEKIKNLAPFTIQGFIVNVKGINIMTEEGGEITTEDQYIYVLDKSIFNDAVKNTVSVFVSDEDYQNFINDTQPEIKNEGRIIEDIYIQNQITITEGRISAEEKIFTTTEELSQYLLFGTLEDQREYIVKSGDNITDIAYNNQLSVEEFLIANPSFTDQNNLLYEGQKVNLGLIEPKFQLIEEDHVVEIQTKKYDTKIEYDTNMLVGYEQVKQQGENGTIRVTTKVQKANGDVKSAIISNTEEIKPTIPKIIVRGSKVVPTVGNPGLWYWPTNKPYYISSSFGWRWGKMHEGLDITGTGHGSPIYAANNGTVEIAGYNSTNGNYIYINHNNGYYTIYAHLAQILVKQGQAVSMGTKIGTMGSTGFSTGTHLHFSIYYGYPYRGGVAKNPLNFY